MNLHCLMKPVVHDFDLWYIYLVFITIVIIIIHLVSNNESRQHNALVHILGLGGGVGLRVLGLAMLN